MPKTKKANPTVSKEQETHNRSTSIGGNVTNGVAITGDGNQTFFQKAVDNIFRSVSENTDHHNRRMMINHVDEFWVKGILEKSLQGVALLELGIKEDPTAVYYYPWSSKKASTADSFTKERFFLSVYFLFLNIVLTLSSYAT